MKASVFHTFGGPKVIATTEIDPPVLQVGEVLVQVEAVSVNHVDTFIRNGRFKTALTTPHIIGRDLVGTVLDAGTSQFHVGDPVWSNAMGYDGRMGATAEQVAVPAELLFPVPAGVDHLQLVAAVHSAATASIVVQDVMHATAGQSILIEGAGGHVGTKLVALAHQMGLAVTTTSHPRDFTRLTELGADQTLNYHAPLTGDLVDHVIDTSGQADLNANLRQLKQGGEVTLITAPTSGQFAFDVAPFYQALKQINGFVISHATVAQLQRAAEQLNAQFAAGRLLDDKLQTLPFEAAAQAHAALESGADHGTRIVLTP